MKKIYAILTFIICAVGIANAQRTKFYNLTADEVRIDSVLPSVAHNYILPENHGDSIFSIQLKYAEYLDMTPSEIERYKAIAGEEPGEMPKIEYSTICNQTKSQLLSLFCPVVKRNNKYQFIVSFMVEVNAKAVSLAKGASKGEASPAERYAAHSILKSGQWAKIRVSESGIHQLTDAVIRNAGFSDPSKVKIYGYGGNLVPETLSAEYLTAFDDLSEVPTCTVNGKRLFYANGPVYWTNQSTTARVRNPYSDYGYYFLTESSGDAKTISEEELLGVAKASNANYHSLYEVDNYAWFQGGRKLVDKTSIPLNSSKTYNISVPEGNKTASFTVVSSAATATKVQILINDSVVGTQTLSLKSDNDLCSFATSNYTVKNNLKTQNKVTLKTISGGPARLDYIAASFATPKASPVLASDAFPAPEYVYRITNQDLHADSAYDMVIIIPTTQKFVKQAQRLKDFHEKNDSMKVRIVPADELYNEFSSGTPDVSAYKRYMKMIYDRSPRENGVPLYPKHLLLFGDCLWDNRMNTKEASALNPDDYLLCFESENSSNKVECFVSDDFIGMLDDSEALTRGSQYTGIPDIGIGRIPATSTYNAEGVVDKIINYATRKYSGSWENTVMFMGDDGNKNLHMEDVNKVADSIIKDNPGLYVRKVMWDAYEEVKSSTGNAYPEVTSIIRQQQDDGALIMDYAGHGGPETLSAERVIQLKDFTNFRGNNLPLWITASCEIMPFDMAIDNIGEHALMNSNGGAIAFFGTSRTVYSNYNYHTNNEFMRIITSKDKDGKAITFGDANRLTKASLVETGKDPTVNKLQYSLLGDPALRINFPTLTAVIDSIDGHDITEHTTTIHAGSVVNIKGHIANNGEKTDGFNGLVTAMVRDTEEIVTCRMNNTSSTNEGTDKAMVFTDRTKILFNGTDSIRNGEFTITFAVPKDINYSDGKGLITLYAINNTKTLSANGACDSFYINGSEIANNDSIGPSIFCYLNTPDFTNGAIVNATPFFVAQIEDKDGINASGAGMGHDLLLIIDGDASKTYSLNKNFQFDFGSYQSGQTYYSIPELEPGKHTLKFRAWDNNNNPSTTSLNFEVQAAQTPQLTALYATPNPASDSVTFVISHNRPKTNVAVKIEVMDVSGRLLYSSTAEGMTSTDNVYKTTWDLRLASGGKVQTGVYLYRASLSANGSSWTSKASRLVVVR